MTSTVLEAAKTTLTKTEMVLILKELIFEDKIIIRLINKYNKQENYRIRSALQAFQ